MEGESRDADVHGSMDGEGSSTAGLLILSSHFSLFSSANEVAFALTRPYLITQSNYSLWAFTHFVSFGFRIRHFLSRTQSEKIGTAKINEQLGSAI